MGYSPENMVTLGEKALAEKYFLALDQPILDITSHIRSSKK